jgi:hypothetical protein
MTGEGPPHSSGDRRSVRNTVEETPYRCDGHYRKPLKGFLLICEGDYRTVSGLASWLDKSVECVKSKPPKKKKVQMSRKAWK